MTELERLEKRVNEIKWRQANCNHVWGEIKYEPEQKEIMREDVDTVGVDIWYKMVPTGRYETVDRWSRTCNNCEKKEYTYEQEDVVVKSIKRAKFK